MFNAVIEQNQIPYDQVHQGHQYYQIDCDQTLYDQVVICDPGEYSAYSTSGHPVKPSCDYGVHPYVNGPMPNFSWVGDATNVDGWLGGQDMNDHRVYEYISSEAQTPASLYGGAPVYDPGSGYGYLGKEDQSESQVGGPSGPVKKKKCGKKAKRAKFTEGKMEKVGVDGIALNEGQLQSIPTCMEGGQIEKQIQGLQIEDGESCKR